MLFELWNPHVADMEFTIGAPIGTVKIRSKEYFPTPEQEAKGILAKDFADLIGPSFLAPTPQPARRRLLEAAGLPVPEVVLAATRHLPEFQGAGAGVADGAPKAQATPTTQEDKLKAAGLGKFVPKQTGDELQKMVDSKSSSSREKRPVDVS